MLTRIHLAILFMGGILLSVGVLLFVQGGIAWSLQNGDFEKGLESWLGAERHGTALSIHGGGRGGGLCLRIEGSDTGLNQAGVHQRIGRLEPGATYRLSGWARGVQGETAAKLSVEFYDLRGENTSNHPVVVSLEEKGKWMPVSIDAPADAVLADLIIAVAGGGAVEVDEVRFEKIAERPALRVVSRELLAVEADTGAEVTFFAAFAKPPGRAQEAFAVQIDGHPLSERPKAERIDARHYRVMVKLPAMAPGRRTIEITHGDLKAAEPIVVEVAPRLRKPDWLGEKGEHRREKRPFFPIGIYHVRHSEEEYATLAAHGFNVIQGKFPAGPDDLLASLDLARRHGLFVDVPLYAGGRVGANLANSLELIRRAAAHPAVFCWKIIDEPDADRNGPVRGEVPRVYAAIKQMKVASGGGPPQPVELTLCQPEQFGYWSRFCDLVQVDHYPIPGGSLAAVHDYCVKARGEAQPWQNLTFVLQCGWTPDLTTQPSEAQARAMVYLALIGGARGISWYSKREGNWDLEKTPLWKALPAIHAEVQALAEPLLRGTEVAVSAGNPEVRVTGRRLGDRVIMLLCNPGEAAACCTIGLPQLRDGRWGGAVRRWNGGETPWRVEGGEIKGVTLGPLEALALWVDALEGGAE